MRSGDPGGSGRALRLDPFALPVRFTVRDNAADEQVRDVELHRERIVMRRSLRGMRVALNLPVAVYAGVSLRLARGEGGKAATVAVTLEHRDPALALPLFVSEEGSEAPAIWHAWAEVLGLPLLVEDDGRLRDSEAGAEPPCPRRRRSSGLAKRRPRILMRRKAGCRVVSLVYRDEREIIARD